MALREWSYKGFGIEESLKPSAEKFQYFFRVKKAGAKMCTYCVWITDEVVNRKSNKTSKPEKFKNIIKSDRDTWIKWVKDKIDQEVLNDLALKISASGKTEIRLSEIGEKIEF